ncbi:unnamed protein product [Ambrosiozyma monospora]|uniref:Unnamed protein product n=1 Tax=Ambrosiozyma monospora TaxID=43982 RepID=A0ACB5U0C5_AMBMO|nr:unnamed protein product [Ambrosiozyma monospora]
MVPKPQLNLKLCVLELAMRMLKQYISGPLQTSTPHVIVWLYFISAVGESVNKYPKAKPLFTYLMARYIPWMKLIPYLNDILCIVRSSPDMRKQLKEHLTRAQNSNNRKEILTYFAENENLWEVWKCWGSLWFDSIALKQDYNSVFDTGIKADIFDLPTAGPRYNADEDPARYVRIVLLATYISENFPDFGLVRSNNIFKYKLDESISALESSNASAAYFSQDQRFNGLFEKPTPMLTITEFVPEVLDLNNWCSGNDAPELPTWDYNSYPFMTDFINNHYPIPMGATGAQGQENSNYDENEGDADFEDDDDDSVDDGTTSQDQQYDPESMKIPGDLD